MTDFETKSAFVGIVGKPNVGKSTLLNTIIGEKIAITANKPQTTRHKISGILTKDNMQLVFVDTPGMHKGKHLLNKKIDKIAVSTLKDVDIILFVVDRPFQKAEEHILKYFEKIKVPVYLVINKIDLLKTNNDIDEIIISYLAKHDFKGYFPISAKDDKNIDKLLADIEGNINYGPFYYPVEMISDQSETTLMAEFVREKIIYYTEEEIPHATAVTIESIKYNEEYKTLDIGVLIIVERASQKKIMIGKNGSKLKEIGKMARLDINEKFDVKSHLEIWVKVKKDWRNKDRDISSFGYGNE